MNTPKMLAEKIVFIVHWSYLRYQDEAGLYHFRIDTKEVFECVSTKDFISQLRKVLFERRISKEEIKAIQMATKIRMIITDDFHI